MTVVSPIPPRPRIIRGLDHDHQHWQKLAAEHQHFDGLAAEFDEPAEVVAEAISTLNARERYVLFRRYGRAPSLSLAKLGKELGVGTERVRQIEGIASVVR